jgi:enoyl-[acyl-carrier protein] reductase I
MHATVDDRGQTMNFLNLRNRNIVIFGVANRRSIAFAVSRVLAEAGANLVYVVKDKTVRERVQALLERGAQVLTCDVEKEAEIAQLRVAIGDSFDCLHGIVHSIAFASYTEGFGAFHQTLRKDFLQAMDISCYSLIRIAHYLQPLLAPDAAIVTLSISDTRMAAENYGYMGPVKAALNSTVAFLAKSLSGTERQIRVNAVGAGLLKTSSSAGIPGYIDSYLYAEQAIPRKQHLQTTEVADVVAFLLSPRASGINAQTVVVDAGMSINYFDREIVRKVTGGAGRT